MTTLHVTDINYIDMHWQGLFIVQEQHIPILDSVHTIYMQ